MEQTNLYTHWTRCGLKLLNEHILFLAVLLIFSVLPITIYENTTCSSCCTVYIWGNKLYMTTKRNKVHSSVLTYMKLSAKTFNIINIIHLVLIVDVASGSYHICEYRLHTDVCTNWILNELTIIKHKLKYCCIYHIPFGYLLFLYYSWNFMQFSWVQKILE